MGFSRGFWLVTISTSFYFFTIQLTFPLIPLFVTDELHAVESLIGTGVLLATISSMVLRLPSGSLTDRFGRRPVMLVGALTGILYPISMAAHYSVGAFMVSRLVHGISICIFTTAVKAYIADNVPAERRGEAFGINTSAFSLALIIGPLSGEALKNAFDFRMAFFAGALSAAVAFIVLIFVPGEENTQRNNGSILTSTKEVLKLRGAWSALMTAFSGAGLFAAFFVYFPLYAERHHFETDAPSAMRHISISLAFSLFAVINLIAMPRAGRMSDRRGRLAAVIPGVLLSIPGVIILALARNLWIAYLGVAIIAVGFSFLRAMMDAIMQDATPHWLRGTGAAILFGAWDCGIGVESQLMGMAIENFGFDAMYGLALVLLLGFGWLAIFLGQRAERERVTLYKGEFPPLPTQ